MKIKKIKVENYRSISNVDFEFDPLLNVFVGVNGSGKTTILDALTISLSWLVNRIQRENVSGKHIPENDIRNNTSYSLIETYAIENNKLFDWTLVKTRKGQRIDKKSSLSKVSELADFFRDKLENENSLPVIAYYPVNRVVKDISPEISNRDNFYVLDVYDNALEVKANFQSFFEWFRMQDDILNEKLGSRTKWMISNKNWIRKKVDKIISYIGKTTTDFEDFKYLTVRLKQDDIVFEEPRYLFRELIDLLHSVEFKSQKENRIDSTLHDIEYLLHIMGSLSDSRRDNLISTEKFPNQLIERIFKQLEPLLNEPKFKDEQKYLIQFIWESLQFSLLLGLWWMSDKGKRDIESLFKGYNPILQKNKREWQNISKLFLSDIEQIVKNDTNRHDIATKNEGREIRIVTNAIENFIDGYSNLRIKRIPRPHMLVDKNGETFNLEQLSDGEKNLIALIGDIARRLSIANPFSKEPLKGDGVILIDEIDLHLHPEWQKLAISKLSSLFPNCQFFITTHSPLVISHVKPNSLFLLKNKDNVMTYEKPEESFGMTVDRVVELIMDQDARPSETKMKLNQLYELIERNKIQEAKNILKGLKTYLKSDSDILRAEMLIRKKEMAK